MSIAHTDLASGRWHMMTLVEQMGNVGSEYERARRSHQDGNTVRFQRASDRFLELLDLTLSDPRWRGRRLRELARVREGACEELFGESSGKSFEKYFLEFATAARAHK